MSVADPHLWAEARCRDELMEIFEELELQGVVVGKRQFLHSPQ